MSIPSSLLSLPKSEHPLFSFDLSSQIPKMYLGFRKRTLVYLDPKHKPYFGSSLINSWFERYDVPTYLGFSNISFLKMYLGLLSFPKYVSARYLIWFSPVQTKNDDGIVLCLLGTQFTVIVCSTYLIKRILYAILLLTVVKFYDSNPSVNDLKRIMSP